MSSDALDRLAMLFGDAEGHGMIEPKYCEWVHGRVVEILNEHGEAQHWHGYNEGYSAGYNAGLSQ